MAVGAALLEAIAAEFRDIGDLEQLARIVVRLLLASVLGFALG